MEEGDNGKPTQGIAKQEGYMYYITYYLPPLSLPFGDVSTLYVYIIQLHHS